MNRLVVASVTLAVAVFACRDSGGGGDDTDVDAPVNTDDVRIQDIQSNNITAGTAVNVKGVVVTVIDTYGGKTGDFWVQEPGGGEFSGVHVFGAELADVGALQPGDLVDIEGAEKDEFAYQGMNGSGGDTSGRSVTELKPVSGGKMKVTKVGSMGVPAPQMVDALAIGQKATQAERDMEWEKWEGVLITVTNISAFETPKCVGSACNDDTLNAFDATGGIVVESALAPLPGFVPKMGTTAAVPSDIKRADCIASVTGVVDYFFDYLLLNTEIVKGGTGCATEATHAVCSDNIDNDGNGFVDCMDFSCQQNDPACSVAATVSSVQMGMSTGPVTLTNVYVTARDEIGSSRGIWVADALAGAPHNGVFVFTGNMVDATFVIGAQVNVSGTVTEFDTGNPQMGDKLTEITNTTVTLVAGTPGVPTGAAVTAAQVADITTGEPYEGVLVTLQNLKITNNAAGQGKIVLVDNAGTSITADDDIFMPGGAAPANGTCYSSYTGVMSVQLIDNIRTLNARSAADMVVGAGCN